MSLNLATYLYSQRRFDSLVKSWQKLGHGCAWHQLHWSARRIEKLQIGGLGKTIVIIAACIFTAEKVHTAPLHLEGRINQKKLL